MDKNNVISSYIVYDKLYLNDKKCDAYDILQHFILSVFFEYDNTANLSILDVKEGLKNFFGFNVPIAVIEDTLIKMVTKNDIKRLTNSNKFVLNKGKNSNGIEKILSESNDEINVLFEDIKVFAKKLSPNLSFSIEEITNHLCNVLLAEESERAEFNEKDNIVLKYIISCGSDNEKLKIFEQLKEGYIIYLGVCNDIKSVKNINDTIVIYLDQEIIFYLMDLDNEISKESVLDLINYIKIIDTNNKVKFRYFHNTKKAIDAYFDKACEIKSNKKLLDPTKIAMSKILNSCRDVHDINLYKADLYTKLKKEYQILEDEPKNYYDKKYDAYNLERFSADIANVQQDELFAAMQYISNINKLRHGENNKDFFSTKAYFVTNTVNYLRVSQYFKKDDNNKIDFSYSLNHFTNIIWYLSSKKYNLELPSNFKVYNYVKNVMQKLIGDGIAKEYDKNMKEWMQGDLDEEKAAFRIKVLSDEQEKIYKHNSDPMQWEQINTSVINNKALLLEKTVKDSQKKDEEIEKLKEEIKGLKNENEKIINSRISVKVKKFIWNVGALIRNLLPLFAFIFVAIILLYILSLVLKHIGMDFFNTYFNIITLIIIILSVLLKTISKIFYKNPVLKAINKFLNRK